MNIKVTACRNVLFEENSVCFVFGFSALLVYKDVLEKFNEQKYDFALNR